MWRPPSLVPQSQPSVALLVLLLTRGERLWVLQEPVSHWREEGERATSPGPAQAPPGCVTLGSKHVSEPASRQL